MVFGAGCIGRGLLGELAARAGRQVIFVEAASGLADALRQSMAYTVRLVGREPRETPVADYRVLSADDAAQIGRAVRACCFAATAVGGRNLPAVAGLLAPALEGREQPLNVMVCENWPHAESVLSEHLERAGAPAVHYRCVPCSVERMVRATEDGLDLVGEGGESLYLDASHWCGPLPRIPGFCARDDLAFYYARKLFTNNAGQAVLAYEGHLAGYELVCEAHADPLIRERVEAVLDLATQMLTKEYAEDPKALDQHVQILLEHRFANRELADPIRRVGRDPLRKLGPEERLVGLLRRLQKHNLPIGPVCRTIACTLHYHDPENQQSAELRRMLRSGGPERVLTEVCRLKPREEACRECLRQWKAIEKHESSAT